MADELDVPQGRFTLARHPVRKRETLRAWDAADEYIMQYFDHEIGIPGSLAIVNDTFGALAIALLGHNPNLLIDSENGRLGLAANIAANGTTMPRVQSSLAPIEEELSFAVVKVPKSLGQLEDQLHRLRLAMHPGAMIVGAGMTRHVHTSTLDLFEMIIGTTITSPARKKARLIHATFDPDLDPPPNPWPLRWQHNGRTIVNHGGVFSARKIDAGTQLILGHLPDLGESPRVIDLGCGNGIVGTFAAAANPGAEIVFIDESYRALESAQETWRANFDGRDAEFLATDRLVNVVDRESANIVLINPPFHDDRSTGDATTWDMFIDAHAVLRSGGELRVVGNRHLAHHAKLQKIFGNHDVVASNNKFVVLSARRA